MQLIKSPFQNIGKKSTQQGVVDISVLLKKLKEVDDVIESFQDLKEKLIEDNKEQFQSILKDIKQEVSKLKELRSYAKGEPGVSPDINQIVREVMKNIRLPKDGVTPVVDTLEIAKAAAKFVKVPEPGVVEVKQQVDLEKVADAIIDMFQKGKKKLSTKHIGDFTDGMEQYTRPLRSLSFGNRGGGDVVKAGSNITITTDADGKKVITSTGGSATIYTETPSGLINGSNKVYTVSNTVTTVIGFWINGQFIHPSEYTSVGTTITFVTALDASLSGTGFTISYT